MHKRILFLLLYFFLGYNVTNGQDPTGSINITGGGSATFIINTLTKYKEGASLNNWTKLRLKFDDSGGKTTGWVLQITTDISDANRNFFISDDGNNLDLDFLKIRVSNIEIVSGIYNGTIPPSEEVTLSNAYQTLLTDTRDPLIDPPFIDIDLIVTLSYDFAKEPPPSLLGELPGLYFVTLQFNLISIDI